MNEDTKKCPFCAETIKAEAKICRFCHMNLITRTLMTAEDKPLTVAKTSEEVGTPATKVPYTGFNRKSLENEARKLGLATYKGNGAFEAPIRLSDDELAHAIKETLKRKGINDDKIEEILKRKRKDTIPRTVKAESSVEDGVKIGFGMFIVLPLLILGVILLLFIFLLGIGSTL